MDKLMNSVYTQPKYPLKIYKKYIIISVIILVLVVFLHMKRIQEIFANSVTKIELWKMESVLVKKNITKTQTKTRKSNSV